MVQGPVPLKVGESVWGGRGGCQFSYLISLKFIIFAFGNIPYTYKQVSFLTKLWWQKIFFFFNKCIT